MQPNQTDRSWPTNPVGRELFITLNFRAEPQSDITDAVGYCVLLPNDSAGHEPFVDSKFRGDPH